MDYYQPFQNLNFVYFKSTNALFISSNIQVFIDRQEGIGNFTDFPAGSSTARISLLINRDFLSDAPNVAMQQVLILIINPVPSIPFDPVNDADNFKDALRSIIDQDLANRGASFYTVITSVTKLDSTPGGTVTNTISSNGNIEII